MIHSRTTRLALGIGASLLFAFAANAQGPRGPRPPGPPPGPPPDRPAMIATTQQQAADAVQRAYDALGRSMALSQSAAQDTKEILSRARESYQQALTQYQASNFVGARETAMAAADMARAAEQIAGAHLIEAASRQTQIPAPPATDSSAQSARAYDALARVSDHSARLTADLSSGTATQASPQIRSLMGESRRLQQRAQSLLSASKPEEAASLARGADALLAAADHMQQRALIASGAIPAQAAPPPPPPGAGAAPPPPPPDAGAPPPPPPADAGAPPPPPQS
ncbi:MAG: hypothetical protein ACR2JE_11030 [Acidobacteriaceae bacterium]